MCDICLVESCRIQALCPARLLCTKESFLGFWESNVWMLWWLGRGDDFENKYQKKWQTYGCRDGPGLYGIQPIMQPPCPEMTGIGRKMGGRMRAPHGEKHGCVIVIPTGARSDSKGGP